MRQGALQCIVRFFEGYRDNPNPTTGAVQQYLIHSEEKLNADTNEWEIIQICFEINYNTGQWRKLRMMAAGSRADVDWPGSGLRVEAQSEAGTLAQYE